MRCKRAAHEIGEREAVLSFNCSLDAPMNWLQWWGIDPMIYEPFKAFLKSSSVVLEDRIKEVTVLIAIDDSILGKILPAVCVWYED